MIGYAEWWYYRFALSLRMVEELLAARGIGVTYETVRAWAGTFGLAIAKRIRSAVWGRSSEDVALRDIAELTRDKRRTPALCLRWEEHELRTGVDPRVIASTN
ncbi:hypothetical protein WK04_11945 [Burkholderia ubonensis]|nr:hypothetical protein WK04_11945 [Burkholderia ubonensis]